VTPHGPELTVQSEVKQSQQSLRTADWEPTLGAFRRTNQDIARAEFGKQRKRLGVLSAEQEAAIEALLISTVNKISHSVGVQLWRLIETTLPKKSAKPTTDNSLPIHRWDRARSGATVREADG
jgi:glutamyl-tRNA reductase